VTETPNATAPGEKTDDLATARDPEHRMSRRSILVAVLAVAAGAFAIRLWGVNWALPYIHNSDEPTTTRIVQTMVANWDPNPHFFHWPSLPFYIQAVPYLAYVGLGMAFGLFASPQAVPLPIRQGLGSELMMNPNVVRVGRTTTMVIGTLIVVVVILLALYISRRIWVGIVAGLIAAVEPMLVKNARWMTPDAYAAFFSLAAVAMSVVIYRSGRWWHYVLAGAFAGAAASSKYNTAIVVVTIALAHLLRVRGRFFTDRGIYLAALTSIVVFLATTPALVFSPTEAWAGITYDLSHYSTAHVGFEGGAPAFYLTRLATNLGPLLLLAPFAFLVRGIRIQSLIVASYPLLHILLISRYVVRFERNMLPAIAPLVILVALGMYGIVSWLRSTERWRGRRSVIAAAGVLLILSIPALLQMVDDARRYSGDHRAQAQAWIDENVQPGSRVIVDAYSPWVDPGKFDVVGVGFVLTSEALEDSESDYIVLTRGGSGRFLAEPERYEDQVGRFDRFLDGHCEVAAFTGYEDITIYARECRK
jgi:4-amino-4-deoxy-L-arabinose transferase-like glycosyltransferase